MKTKTASRRSNTQDSSDRRTARVSGTAGVSMAPPAYGVSSIDSQPVQAKTGPEYQPSEGAPSFLLAHELAHTAQMRQPDQTDDNPQHPVAIDPALDARAFTIGQNIHFGEQSYEPSSDADKHLLAHELAHIVQQRGK